MQENVIIEGAPGRRPFLGITVPGLRDMPPIDSRGSLTAVIWDDGTPGGFPAIVPSSAVRDLSPDEISRIRGARLYRREWAVKTGRSERDVYIPDAIRPRTVPEEAW